MPRFFVKRGFFVVYNQVACYIVSSMGNAVFDDLWFFVVELNERNSAIRVKKASYSNIEVNEVGNLRVLETKDDHEWWGSSLVSIRKCDDGSEIPVEEKVVLAFSLNVEKGRRFWVERCAEEIIDKFTVSYVLLDGFYPLLEQYEEDVGNLSMKIKRYLKSRKCFFRKSVVEIWG